MIANRSDVDIDVNGSAALHDHVSCLTVLMNDIPTEYLLPTNSSLRTASGATMMDISDSEDEDEDVMMTNNNNNNNNNNGGNTFGEYKEGDVNGGVRCFAPLQVHQDDPYGAGSRLLKGILMNDAMKKGIERNETNRKFDTNNNSGTSKSSSKMDATSSSSTNTSGSTSDSATTTGCEGCRLLLSTSHAIRLFEAVLPSTNTNNNTTNNTTNNNTTTNAKEGEQKMDAYQRDSTFEQSSVTTLHLCSLYDQIFERLNVVRTKQRELVPPAGEGLTLLSGMSFRPFLVSKIWYGLKIHLQQWCSSSSLQLSTQESNLKKQKTNTNNNTSNTSTSSNSSSSGAVPNMSPELERAFCFFCTCYSHLLLSLTDLDVYEKSIPFPLSEQGEFKIEKLKN